MTTDTAVESFTKGLFTRAKEVGHGLPVETMDTEEAASVVLTHLLMSAMLKTGNLPLAEDFDEDSASWVATFGCFLSAPMFWFLQRERERVELSSILFGACVPLLRTNPSVAPLQAIPKGIKNYETTRALGIDHDIGAWEEEIADLVRRYVTTGDESTLDRFAEMYTQLREIQDSVLEWD